MTCTKCGEKPKKACGAFPKAVIEIDNPETLVLLRKVVIPASMGDETAFPPAIGKYFNVLLHYEASGSNYLYSSDGIPTEIGANIPQEVLDRIEALEDGYDDLAEDYEQLQSQIGDVSEALSAETSARELADGNLQSQVGNVSEALSAETSARKNADIGLQGQIDAITSSSDVKDIVGTYTELQNYDTSTLGNDDIIKVLQDSTHNNAMTYYRWIISGGAGSWQYIGEEGPYYTKSETETLLNNKQDEITSSNKLLSDLVDDTNQTNKFVTENEKTTWNTEIENLQEEDELLKRNLQTTTGSGEEVTLEKTAELDFVKPPLPRGNTKQDTTTGKNLLQNTATSQTVSGVTFTVNSDGSVTCNGTATANTIFRTVQTPDLPDNVDMLLTGCPVGGSLSTYQLQYSNNRDKAFQDMGNGIVVQKMDYNTYPNTYVQIRIMEGYTCNNLTFYPMIRLATIEDDTYEPYTGGIPSPNPDYPQEIRNVTGNVEVTISNENNTESKTLPVSLGNIELCKIGNYQDYLYKNNGKWYKYNAINKLVLNGSENWSISNNVFYLASISDYVNSSGKICLSDKYTAINNTDIGTSAITQNNSICFFITNTNPRLYIRDERFNNVNAFKAELSEDNVKVYYPTATPTSTEITDATLISQLEEISKTLSYQGQTNITSNTIALFDVEAYQDLKIILEDIYKAFPTDTASGAVASFTDGADDLPLKSLVIDINPVQDLHGQDAPYPAGGGKNKFNGTFLQGYWAYADGAWVNSRNWITTEKIPCKASTSYTVSADAKATRWQGFVWYDSNGNFISTDNLQSSVNIGLTKTSPSNAAYLIFNIAGYPGANDTIAPSDVTHFQLEEGQTATSYAPYSNICPISGYSEAKVYVSPTQDAQDATVYTIDLDGARYGGTLDVTTGKLTVDRAMVDLGARNWYLSTAAGRTRFRTSITDIERISSPNIIAPMLCSKYPTKSANQTYQGTTGVSLQQNSADIYIYDPQTESMTTAEFKSAMSGVQLVYKLATPIEIQLAPHELNTLLGVNNIWANTGDTEVEYRADTKLYINKMIGDAET